jgi:putative membrane protein
MKKKLFSFALCLSAAVIWSCNNSGDSTSGNDSGSKSGDSMSQGGTTGSNNTNNTTNATPLSKDDSSFVMEAAAGGMMEVQAGQLAQQNAASQRVKDFGNMMVTDHTKANDELKSFASGRGITIPTALPADMQKHLDAMKSMKGKTFDSHYMTMMNDDHKKDIDKFKKQSQSGTDSELKTWATNTLPTLQKHMDSVTAIKKGM